MRSTSCAHRPGTQFDPESVEAFILRALPALRPKVIEPDSAEVAAARGRGSLPHSPQPRAA